MAVLPKSRQYTRFNLFPPIPSTAAERAAFWRAEATPELILEAITPHAELKSVGRARFTGTTSNKNFLWFHYRNFLRQAVSNFRAALDVPNRSSSLLYYYAMLNFAKAELVDTHSQAIVNRRIGHGLSFDPTRAKTVVGDSLVVRDGVFRMLYERRTGHSIPVGTRLPLKPLLSAIPEIGSQLNASGLRPNFVASVDMMIASDATESWILLRVDSGPSITEKSTTRSLVFRHFREVEAPPGWRDHFGVSPRMSHAAIFLESKSTAALTSSGEIDIRATLAITDAVRDIIYLPGMGEADALISPYLYKTTRVTMPPSIARYAVSYYASSLVRYRPTAFDANQFPEQAFLFDCVARECATPMLVDTLSALERNPQIFVSTASLRR